MSSMSMKVNRRGLAPDSVRKHGLRPELGRGRGARDIHRQLSQGVVRRTMVLKVINRVTVLLLSSARSATVGSQSLARKVEKTAKRPGLAPQGLSKNLWPPDNLSELRLRRVGRRASLYYAVPSVFICCLLCIALSAVQYKSKQCQLEARTHNTASGQFSPPLLSTLSTANDPPRRLPAACR